MTWLHARTAFAAAPLVFMLLAAVPSAQGAISNVPNAIVHEPAEDTGDGVDAVRIGAEFMELHALLDGMREHFGGSHRFPPVPGHLLALRLALFPHRFGSDPRAAAQWPELQSAAAQLLAERTASTTPGSFVSLQDSLDLSTLLQLTDRRDEARKLLEDATISRSGCYECEADQSLVLDQRRSEWSERDGDLNRAMQLQLRACLDAEANPFAPGPGDDLMYARCGQLLCLAGHEAEGALVLRSVPSACQDTPGAQFAREELARRGVPADAPRVFLLRGFGIVAVGTADRPGAMQWIAADVSPQPGTAGLRELAVLDPVAFEGKRPALEQWLLRGPPETREVRALTLLEGLEGGAAPYLAFVLSADATQRSRDETGSGAVEWLRRVSGQLDLDKPPIFFAEHEFIAAWRAWLELD